MSEEVESKTEKKPLTGRQVFVGNLAWEVKWQDLKDHMGSAGEVEFADILLRPDGRSKGVGLVRFKEAEDAKKAMETLTNTELMGRLIFVREDREVGKKKAPRKPKQTKPVKKTTTTEEGSESKEEAGSGANSGGTHQYGEVSVFIGNIPWSTQWQELKELFADYNVLHVDCGETRNGRARGWAITKFATKEDAEAAIKDMNGYELDGRTIEVRYDNKA
mmetsp:Transcript_11544/g.28441  ORF Transcript_11544/g.28441 Transcript_11544/m.28441 type:complete len:219 (-) Transcript_11544:518-1174(-)|eukprot:CAMPEP_0114509986 /NCGR_PEP_ID=MMETSP0109-20121206/13525_1 /TAXON_ID=29199 /ORGANISM="Chlorarachnion reptans, Strain CCCM449" /LENGTH=218 /DNA_ID=CAMNT_0001689221 /DNA_START=394 /DNA_END=1050 /DNA_ORIENTATION=+